MSDSDRSYKGRCVSTVSFWFEGQEYNKTFDVRCNSCKDLLDAQIGPDVLLVCFKGAPKTSDTYPEEADSVTMTSPHQLRQMKVALTVFGTATGVSLLVLICMACSLGCCPGWQCCSSLLCCWLRSRSAWDKFHEQTLAKPAALRKVGPIAAGGVNGDLAPYVPSEAWTAADDKFMGCSGTSSVNDAHINLADLSPPKPAVPDDPYNMV